MTRRDALSRVSLILGGTIVGAELFLNGCGPSVPQVSATEFTAGTISFLDEVGEIIIPTSASSPGAKAAKIGEFMKTIVTECYEAKNQKIFFEGIGKLGEAAKAKSGGKTFLELEPEAQKALLTEIDAEAKAYAKENVANPEAPKHYFALMKQLTLWGYFSSEVGATQALRYVEAPGPYKGCIPYTKGEKAWAL